MYSTLITLPHASSSPASARQLIDQIDCLRPEVAMNARLLVSELVANAVRHVPRDGEIGMHVSLVGDSLRVEVVDPGNGFVPRARTSASPLGSGWGLHLVDELSDRWGVESTGPTRVWFEVDGAVEV
ncbi:MAG: ATP-binding protein [Solirubrobacterales bacterium]|nr:ATP-binding protein [Solirubrobacterales bacterium]